MTYSYFHLTLTTLYFVRLPPRAKSIQYLRRRNNAPKPLKILQTSFVLFPRKRCRYITNGLAIEAVGHCVPGGRLDTYICANARQQELIDTTIPELLLQLRMPEPRAPRLFENDLVRVRGVRAQAVQNLRVSGRPDERFHALHLSALGLGPEDAGV